MLGGGEVELCEDECVREFRKLLSENKKLSVLQGCDEAYLKRFLYTADLDVEKAFNKIKMFYELLEEHREWFTMDSPVEKKDIIEQDIRSLTNIHDNGGRPVYILKIGNLNARTMSLVKDVVAVDDFFMEHLMMTDPEFKNGICVIIDISNFPWNLLKWLTPGNIKTASRRMQTMPLKEYKIHIVNSSRLISIAVNIIWPLLPQQIKDGVEFHFEDWDSLHKHINRKFLPAEFGGDNKMDYVKLREQLYEKSDEIASNLRSHRQPYLNHIEKDICKH